MKPSRFNLVFEYNGKTLAFNSFSCALAEVNEDFLTVLNDCQKIDYHNDDSELIKNMKDGSYIVEDDFDEIEHLKAVSYSGKFNNRGLGLVIAPTLNCNFACPYCFENPSTDMISTEVKNALFDLAENAAKGKSDINVTWYGGEPLIAKDIIFNMSEKFIDICKKNGVKYSASMITNGYLVDDAIVESMVKARIQFVQITIDGPADIHNSRRKLKVHNKNGTFNTIIENIKKLISKNITVSIRVNIDQTNSNKVEELMDVLKSHNLEKCNVNFGHVRPYTSACSSITSTCFSTEEYAHMDTKLQMKLNSKGFSSSQYPHYPGIKANYCCADSISSFVIDPKGNMYKCWNDIGDISRKVGNVLNQHNYFNRLHTEYLFWSPFKFEECKKCNILPICMGGCPYEGQKQGKPDCEKWRYNLLDILKSKYEKEN